jgi:hypothetical protein
MEEIEYHTSNGAREHTNRESSCKTEMVSGLANQVHAQ